MFNKVINLILGSGEKRRSIIWLAIILVSALIILMCANFLFTAESGWSRLLNWADPGKYQAVFLSNNQVYFGKVVDINRDTLVLSDIYYLRVSQPLQAGNEDEEMTDFSLVKLGNEIHGPEDKMNINLNQVLFIENLKEDSKVTKAIEEFTK